MSSCGMQICSHPQCWEGAKRFIRESHTKKCTRKFQRQRSLQQYEEDEVENHNMIDGIPTMTIVNMLDDYGYTSDHQVSEKSSPNRRSSKGFQDGVPTENFDMITKLQLHSLTNETGNGITPAPANTPLQSSHGFADTMRDSDDSQSHSTVYLPNKRSEPPYHLLPHSITDLKLDSQKFEPKKVYIWKSKQPRSRLRPKLPPVSSKKTTPASNVLLPVEVLPEISTESQWQKQRQKKPVKSTTIGPHLNNDSHKKHDKTSKVARPTLTSKSGDVFGARMVEAPYEIEKLRHVPVEVLLRVIRMAMRNKILTSKQATLLLYQVTGQKYTLPVVKTSQSEEATSTWAHLVPRTITVCQPSGVPPMKLLSETSIYKLDKSQLVSGIKSQTSATEPPAGDEVKKFEDMTDAQQHTSRSAIKSRVGYIGACLGDELLQSTPVKPFHYIRSSQDMTLHPLPTPPPTSPSTERDSQYNEVLGGSTVLVNLSNTRSMSPDRPPSGGSLVSWKQSRASSGNRGTDRRTVSSSKSTMWPQVEENDFIGNDREFVDPSYDDFARRGAADGMDSKLPVLQENITSAVDACESEEASPVPPPPSPEVPHAFEKDLLKEDKNESAEVVSQEKLN